MSDLGSFALLVSQAAAITRELVAISTVLHAAHSEGRQPSAAELRTIKAARVEARSELEEAIARAEAEGR